MLAERLADGDTIPDAARACGIAERTARRYEKSARCQAVIRQIHGATMGRTVGRMIAERLQAIKTLADAAAGKIKKGVPARVAAAKAILELSSKGHEQNDLRAEIELLKANDVAR